MGVAEGLLFICVYVAVVTAIPIEVCPQNCECQPDAIACRRLTSFPAIWPESIARITISESALDEIPPGAFANLANLSRIAIRQSNITNIRQCSFSRLSHVLISIEQCIIDTIDSYAFSYLSHTGLAFGTSFIRVLSPYAFTRSHKAENWDFIGVNITSAETRAFHNITEIGTLNFMTSYFHEVKSLSMSMLTGVEMVTVAENIVDFLYCRTFQEVVRTAGYFGFYGNSLYCDCRLEWLFTSGILTSQGRSENRCHGPQSMIDEGYGSSLVNLTENDLPCDEADLRGKACPETDIPEDPEHQCYFPPKIIPTTPLPSTYITAEMVPSIGTTTEEATTTPYFTTLSSPKHSSTIRRKTSSDTPFTTDSIQTTVHRKAKTTRHTTSKPKTPNTTNRSGTTSSVNPITSESTPEMRTRTPSQQDDTPTTEQNVELSPTTSIPNHPIRDDDQSDFDEEAHVMNTPANDSIDGKTGINDYTDSSKHGDVIETSSGSPAPVVIENSGTVARSEKEGKVTSPSHSQRTVISLFVLIVTIVLLLAL